MSINKTINYSVYRKGYNIGSSEDANLLGKYEFQIWRPSAICFYPKGIKGIRKKLDFILIWVLYYLFSPSTNQSYSVSLIYDHERVIHHCVVTIKSFKYPFMKENDLEIGMIFTESEYRRKGLASYTMRKILKSHEGPDRTIWFITDTGNLASRKLAESVGFSKYSKASRSRVFLLGRYEIVREDAEVRIPALEVPDYSLITELPGLRASREQVARIYQRYHFATQFATGKHVLEIGCGAGLGLGYLANVAKKVVGGDVEEKNVTLAKEYYKNKGNISVDLMDAHNVLLANEGFDLVLLYETIYSTPTSRNTGNQ